MKLLRKDVLKWIRNLKSGQYRKGKGQLVSPNGSRFCCLGVWADQHGCTWEEYKDWDKVTGLAPIKKGAKAKHVDQRDGTLEKSLLFGLDENDQGMLAEINDKSKGFGKVIAYIQKEVLPKAK